MDYSPKVMASSVPNKLVDKRLYQKRWSFISLNIIPLFCSLLETLFFFYEIIKIFLPQNYPLN